MPTTKQLQDNWEAEFTFPWLRPDWEYNHCIKPLIFSGPVIGELVADPETHEIKLVLNNTDAGSE